MTYGILGFRNQQMAERRSGSAAFTRYQVSFEAPNTDIDYEWVCPEAGRYTVYAWGPGGFGYTSVSSYAGGSGALAIAQRVPLVVGDTLTISIPHITSTSGDTTVSIPRRTSVLTAGRGGDGEVGSGGDGGLASGGDVNIDGSAGVAYNATANDGGGTNGGLGGDNGAPGAPGYDGFRGGDAVVGAGRPSGTPGAGGYGSSSSDPQRLGGYGRVIICRDT